MKIRVILLLVFICPFLVLANQKNNRTDIDEKVEELLKKMTLEEKIGQMTQGCFWGKSETRIQQMKEQINQGKIGSLLNLPDPDPAEYNRLQKLAVENSRLGIPLIVGHDVIHGYMTIFPIPLGQAATWDTALIQKAASVAAKEAAAAGVNWTFAPMVDIARDPRWGRIAEGFGEDPYLASAFAAAKVKGFQGTDLSCPSTIAACLKHYVAYGAAEGGRDYNTCDVPERTLREIYLPPFKAGVEAGAATIMSAFNEISGIPATGNRHTLSDILKGEWKFDGFVVSDWGSITEMVVHGYAEDPADAAEKALTAGIDMDMEGWAYSEHLCKMVEQGKVPQKAVDEAVRRILKIKFRLGLFDNPYIDPDLAKSVMLCEKHLETAREVAKKSIVLLKNQGNLLPLKKDIKSLAVIGPLADNRQDLLGTWSSRGRAEDIASILTGIKSKLSPECKLMYAKGCEIDGSSTKGFTNALNLAKQCEAVVMAVGESEAMSGEGHCRASLDLPQIQQQLIHALHKTGKPIVVVLLNSRPMSISWIAENIPAVLVAWHPGTQAGNAVADCLFGDYNPSGKLPVTFPRTVGQVPIYYNHKNTGRPPKQNARYTSKYIDIHWTPLFAFGYGLSYTSFKYGNLKLSSDKITPDQSLTVTAEIENTGDKSGEEVVQLYIRDLVASVTRPIKQLKGFEKISLEPGEKKTVSFTVTREDLSFYNKDMDYIAEPGAFKLWVGPGSTEGLETDFEVISAR